MLYSIKHQFWSDGMVRVSGREYNELLETPCYQRGTMSYLSCHDIDSPKLSTQEKELASSIRWILKGDAGQRAIAGWHFGWKPAQTASSTQWMAPFLAELLTDSYDVVRFIGYHSLKDLPEYSKFDYDFVAPPKNRLTGQKQALDIWSTSDDRPSPSKSLLINSNRQLIKDQFRTLRSQRLDPIIKLVE